MKTKPRLFIPNEVFKRVLLRFDSHRKAAVALCPGSQGRNYYIWRERGFATELGFNKAMAKIEKVLRNGGK